jgi:dTDP-glucose pyrophosphorylase
MAGESKRFKSAGYSIEKYRLEFLGHSIFHWVMKSFSNYSYSDVLFVLGPHNAEDVSFVRKTAQLVFKGLNVTTLSKLAPLLIFNVDTIRPGFKCPNFEVGRNCIEVFAGIGNHWSFIEPNKEEENLASGITEKVRTSRYCCTGAYAFESAETFINLHKLTLLDANDSVQKTENYVSKVIQKGVEMGEKFYFEEVDSERVIPSGTPQEYSQLKKSTFEKFFSIYND